MRKSGAFILAGLLLLLSSCGGRPAAPQESTTQASQSESAAVSAPIPQTGAASEVSLPNGPFPKTAYTPPSAPPRFYTEVTHTLIPRDDYGRLWPYIGGYAVAYWMPGDVLGLCDEKGRVVCDPVYNRAEIIEKDGKQLYKLTKNRLDSAGEDVSRITLAKLDGSWAKEYEGVAYQFPGTEFYKGSIVANRPAFSYDAITVCDNGKWGVIDYEGKELLPCKYNNPVCFSDGLAAVMSDDGESYIYIDIHGAKVLGPYETPPLQKLDNLPEPINDPYIADIAAQTLRRPYGLIFLDSLARFYVNGEYGVIDRSGKVLVSAQYDFIIPLSQELAEIMTGSSYADFKYGIIDMAGHVLLEPQEGRFEKIMADGTVLLDTPQSPVVLDPKTGLETPWRNSNPTDASIMSGPDVGVVIDWGGGKKLSFPNASNVVLLDNGNIALTKKDGMTWYIADKSGKMVAGPFDGRADGFWNGTISVTAGMSGVRDGTENSLRTLYDRDGRRILPEVYRDIIPLEGRYLVRQDNCAGLLDEKGNWIIKTPIYDYLTD